MDLTWSAEEEAFRAEARGWLTANVAEWRMGCGGEPASGDTRDGFAQHLDWERRLFADRWAAVSWPDEHGGRGASLWAWLLFEEEYYRAGAPPRVTQNGIFLLAPSIFEFGNPEQQAGILRRMAAAEDLWCQGWSEPNAGSDLASVSSKAPAITRRIVPSMPTARASPPRAMPAMIEVETSAGFHIRRPPMIRAAMPV